MKKNLRLFAIPITLLGIACTSFLAKAEYMSTPSTGAKGAKIYCFMRNNGNTHEVSWQASYAVIKRQSNSLFKTSPRHAAVMITESVVQSPDDYKNCGNYLGDLFGGGAAISNEEAIYNEEPINDQEAINSVNSKPSKSEVKDRYSY